MIAEPDRIRCREMLLALRARLAHDADHLRRDTNGKDGGISRAPTHLADEGSDTAEQDLMLDRLSSSSAALQEIDEALERIEAGTYGRCEECGSAIGMRRLAIKPYAQLCIECQKQEEES